MGKYLLGCAGIAVIGIILLVIVGAMWADNYNKLVSFKQGVRFPMGRGRKPVPATRGPGSQSCPDRLRSSRLREVDADRHRSARASVGQMKLDPNQAPTDPAKLQQFEQPKVSSATLSPAARRLGELSKSESNQNFLDLQAQLEARRTASPRPAIISIRQPKATTPQCRAFPATLWLEYRGSPPGPTPGEGRHRRSARRPFRLQ